MAGTPDTMQWLEAQFGPQLTSRTWRIVGDLPGFDAAGDLTGSGQYTGQTAACTGDFEIGLEATLAP